MRRLWDFHSHLLPGLDDGAANERETAEMLQAAARCGITDIAATPHLYRVEQFSETARYRAALDTARRLADPLGITIHRAYEVNYRILVDASLSQLRSACLEGTQALLLELSDTQLFPNWDYVLSGLIRDGFQIILAHPERYIYFQNHPTKMEDFLSFGVLSQADASAFYVSIFSRERAAAQEFLKRGYTNFIVSDAHSAKDYSYFAKAQKRYGQMLSKDEHFTSFMQSLR